MTTPNPSEMSLDQLRDESLRLGRELNKLSVLLSASLTSVIQQRFPRPLEQAVEEMAKHMTFSPVQVWRFLRGDHTVRFPSATGGRTTEMTEAILNACSWRGDGEMFKDTPVRDTAVQTMAYARRVEEVMAQKDRVYELRHTLESQERERKRQREAAVHEAGRREAERQLQRHGGKRVPTRREPPAVVPDAPGFTHLPDPMAAASVAEYVELLGRLHVWAGEVSLRELARRSPESIAHSTFGAMLNTPSKLPAQRTVRLFVQALGCDEREVQRWITAWRALRFKRRACRQEDATVTQFRRPASSE